MRCAVYLKAMGLTLGLSVASVMPAVAQSVQVDPFKVAAAQLADSHVATSRAHANTKSADLLSVNLGPAGSENAQAVYENLMTAFTKSYGTPPPQRTGVKSWDVPNAARNPRHTDMTSVMLYISQEGDQMLKLDRRKGKEKTPNVSRSVSKSKPAAVIARQAKNVQASRSVWDGQPD